jgi:hypothetical protein
VTESGAQLTIEVALTAAGRHDVIGAAAALVERTRARLRLVR